MGRTSLRRSALVLLLALGACGGRPSTGRPTYDRNVISAAEIEEATGRGIGNAYDLVLTARSMWLRPSGSGLSGNAGQIVVFENENRLGGAGVLRNIPLSSISAIRFLSPSEAGARFGLNVQYGAIQVISRMGN